MAKDFTYEIKREFGKLGENSNKEMNIISFNGAEAKIDIRAWIEKDGEKKMGKGVALTLEEFKEVIRLGTEYLKSLEEDEDEDF